MTVGDAFFEEPTGDRTCPECGVSYPVFLEDEGTPECPFCFSKKKADPHVD